MVHHPDALEADLQRVYGLDLLDLWRGKLSLRKLSVLVTHLPPGSAVWSAETDLDYGWTLTDILLTDLFHALTGETHPARPKAKKSKSSPSTKDMRDALIAQRKRLAKEG